MKYSQAIKILLLVSILIFFSVITSSPASEAICGSNSCGLGVDSFKTKTLNQHLAEWTALTIAYLLLIVITFTARPLIRSKLADLSQKNFNRFFSFFGSKLPAPLTEIFAGGIVHFQIY